MANGTLSSPFGADFDETSWCDAPTPRIQSIRNVLGYAAAAQCPQSQRSPRITLVLN